MFLIAFVTMSLLAFAIQYGITDDDIEKHLGGKKIGKVSISERGDALAKAVKERGHWINNCAMEPRSLIMFSACIAALLSLSQALYDGKLSSAKLCTKNFFRRFSGWLLRHRLCTRFGYDRGSKQNTEMLLDEQAALPADADEKIRTIYREELQDALDRWKAGSEDANPELQARVELALAG